MRFVGKACCLAIVAMAVSSCASLPDGLGRGEVASLLSDRGQQAPGTSAAPLLAEIDGRPLGLEDAVRIALVSNPQVKAEYARLGFAAAEVYDAGRLSNPRLSFGYLFVDEPGVADKIDLGITQSFTDLLLLRPRSRLAEAEFSRVQQSVAAAIQDIAAQTRSAWYAYVGARQAAAMRQTIARAARISASLAQRFFDAGNITRLELSREQAAAAEAELAALRAEAEVSETRRALALVMGAPTATAWEVAPQMPAPLPGEDSLDVLLKLADQSRLDLAAARRSVENSARALGTTRSFRFLGEVELGVQAERDTDRTRHLGPTLSLELPIFNQKAGTVTRAEAELQTAEAELAALELEIATDLRAAYAGVLNARARTERYRAALIPLREDIVRRTQEQVNYMLVGQFELLLAKQQEYDAYQGYLEAVRDYWLARVELSRAVGTVLPSSLKAPAEGQVLDVESLTQPSENPAAHEGHQASPKQDGSDAPSDAAAQDHSGHRPEDKAPSQAHPHEHHGPGADAPVPRPPPPASPAPLPHDKTAPAPRPKTEPQE